MAGLHCLAAQRRQLLTYRSNQQKQTGTLKEPDSCTTSTEKLSGAGYVKIGFVKFGESFGLVKQEEKYIDPDTGEVKTRYSVVATDGSYLGAEVGVGTNGEVNGSGLWCRLVC